MKRFKIFTILIISLLMPAIASAMTADQVLAKASQTVHEAKSLTVNFTGSADGILTVSGDMFSMVTGGFGVWYNGTDMWTYSQRAGETSLTTPTKSELLESNPMEIIKGYQNKFDAKKVSESGNKCTIKLTAKNKTINVRTATIVINTQTWMPESIDMVFDNDSRMAVNIKSITKGQKLAPSAFAYPANKFKGIEIVDLR